MANKHHRVTSWRYQKAAASAGDGDGDGGADGSDGEGMTTVQVMEGETCVWAATAACIHDYSNDGDDQTLSLIWWDHHYKQLTAWHFSAGTAQGAASRRVLLEREPNRNWVELRASNSPCRRQVSRVDHDRRMHQESQITMAPCKCSITTNPHPTQFEHYTLLSCSDLKEKNRSRASDIWFDKLEMQHGILFDFFLFEVPPVTNTITA